MYCEQKFCIYNHENECVLTEISINSLGMCDDALWININTNLLNRLKEKQLKIYDELEANY